MKMRLCEFREKEVINTCDCRKLGHVADIIFDECSGCVEAIVVPKRGWFGDFFGYQNTGKSLMGDYIIPFKCIKKIGRDIVLVEIHEETK